MICTKSTVGTPFSTKFFWLKLRSTPLDVLAPPSFLTTYMIPYGLGHQQHLLTIWTMSATSGFTSVRHLRPTVHSHTPRRTFAPWQRPSVARNTSNANSKTPLRPVYGPTIARDKPQLLPAGVAQKPSNPPAACR